MPTSLGLFAKHWQPGQVKTRLAKDIGPETAAKLYRQFVETLLKRFPEIADERRLVFAPPEEQSAFLDIAPKEWSVEPQAFGNLGDRLKSFFDARFRDGCRRAVVLGTDSPNVPAEYVQHALDKLKRCDVVLGPTTDGGYWLVGGASRQTPNIFADVPWSTPQVWQATLDALQANHLRCETLPQWYDVDQLADLKRLQSDLQADSTRDEALDSLLEMIQSSLS